MKKKVQELQATMGEKSKELKELNAKLETFTKDRSEKEKDVPKEWIEKYNLMHSSVSNPVVPVIGGSCSACFYHVTDQDLMDLKRKKLLQCKGCYRFLYLEDKTEKTEEIESDQTTQDIQQ